MKIEFKNGSVIETLESTENKRSKHKRIYPIDYIYESYNLHWWQKLYIEFICYFDVVLGKLGVRR